MIHLRIVTHQLMRERCQHASYASTGGAQAQNCAANTCREHLRGEDIDYSKCTGDTTLAQEC